MKQTLSGLVLLFLIFVITGAAYSADSEQLTVSAAISLKNAFEEIGKIFEARYNGVKVALNLGASGDLMAQIKGGAPVDVFASAALKDMDDLGNAGFVATDTRTNFATNSVVLIVPSSSKFMLASFEDLKKAEIQKIAVGNPKTVPVGRYSNETFKYYKIFDHNTSQADLCGERETSA